MEAEPKRRRALLASLRVRTVLGATLIVALALSVAAAALILLTRKSLTDEVIAVTRLRALEIAKQIERSNGTRLPRLADEDELIEIIDPSGQLVAASPHVDGGDRLPVVSPGAARRLTVDFDDDDFIAVATDAETAEGKYRVVAALSLEEVSDSIVVIRRLMVIGIPLVLGVVAFVLWRVVGRSLAPVEEMREQVDRISSSELQRRVPEPDGRDEISRLARTMNRMLARLEKSQEQQRRFISDASHELRSPVASLRQHAEVALAHPEVTSTAALAETVLEESERVQKLVDDLLMLARTDEGSHPRADEQVDLDDLVFEEANRLKASGSLEVSTAGVGAGRVSGDLPQLARAVGNLAQNASRHANKLVSFSLAEEGPWVVLSIEDDGPGIPIEQRSKVFERFVRLDQARDRDRGGAGLGLAIVAEIVSSHGGTVTAAESPLGGARLQVRLPRMLT